MIRKIGEWIYVKGENGKVQKVRVQEGEEVRTSEVVKKMEQGVTNGYKGVIKMVGVGYKAEEKKGKIQVSVGYKEPKEIKKIEGVEIKISGNGTIIVGKSSKKMELRQYLSKIEMMRPARKDKYKGKGVVLET